jgi:RNA polymerase sigma factor (sigma-70 family)
MGRFARIHLVRAVRHDAARKMRHSGRMSSTALEDAALLDAVQTGDEGALETLYRRYGGACFGLARRILDDNQLAEDVVQQVFTALWKGSGFDVRRGAVSTWLMSVTHHKSIDVLRREAPRRKRLASEQALLEVAVTGPGPDEEAWMRLRADRTRESLKTLPAEQRELLLLAYYGGYTQSEIAGLTGLPLGTVKSRTLSAMRKLRVVLSGSVDVDGTVLP